MVASAGLQFVLMYSFTMYAAVITGFVDNSTTVNWETASESCKIQTSNLPEFRNAQTADISRLKTDIHMTPTTDFWTGDFNTFEVATRQSWVNELTDLLCVSATLTSLQVLKNSVRYGFNLTLTGCSEINKYICMCTRVESAAKNVSYLYVDRFVSSNGKTASTACRTRGSLCTLLVPEWSVYRIAVDGDIGHGSVELGNIHNYLKLGEKYWTRIRIRETSGPGHILTCGYITYKEARVMYGSCDQRKGFVCANKLEGNKYNARSVETHVSESLTSWLYGGIAFGILLVAMAVGICIGVLMKWNNHGNDSGILSEGQRTNCPVESENECACTGAIIESNILSEVRRPNCVVGYENQRASVISEGSGFLHVSGKEEYTSSVQSIIHMGDSSYEDTDI